MRTFSALVLATLALLASPLAAPAQTTATLDTLYSFTGGSDGGKPQSGLIQANDGYLYGTTTIGGGSNDGGTVYMISPTGSSFMPASVNFYDAGNPNGIEASLLQASDGQIYGVTFQGGIYKPQFGQFGYVTAFSGAGGGDVFAALIQGSDGDFYGTTSDEGINNAGTVFQIALDGTPATLNYFNSSTDAGSNSYAGLIEGSIGNFYGTTTEGGAHGDGTVFQITADGTLTTLYSFANGSDGGYPGATLVQGTDGNLYGTTLGGGTNGYGTAFRITLDGKLTTLCSFDQNTGKANLAALLLGSDGNFYGTAVGGTTGKGSVYQLTPAGVVTIIYNASALAGNGYPLSGAPLIQGHDGNLYGTDAGGGTSGYGMIYRLNVSLPHVVQFHQAINSIGEQGGTASIRVDRIGGTAPFTVDYTTTDGTAMSSIDYTKTSGTLQWAGDDQSAKFITVPILDRKLEDGSKRTLTLTLSNLSNGVGGDTTLGFPAAATLTINDTPPRPMIGTTATAMVGQPFTYQITASNNPTRYGVQGLPPGFSVDRTTGLISGTPQAAGTVKLTLNVSNAGGKDSKTLTVTISQPPPVITSATTASGMADEPFSYQITASNHPVAFGAQGLPSGLTVDVKTGLISGTRKVPGSVTLTVNASNNAGKGSASVTLDFAPEVAPTITSANTAMATANQPFSYQIAADHYPSSYGAQNLPPGLSINSKTGLISGTLQTPGSLALTLNAYNSAGKGSAPLTVNIAPGPAPVITSATTATATVGQPFSYQITASNNPTSFGVQGLPAGLSVDASTGVISGTRQVPGTVTLTLNAFNSTGKGSTMLTLMVTAN